MAELSGLLSSSQELQLLSDSDVGTMMTYFESTNQNTEQYCNLYEIQENYTQQQTNLIQYQEVIVPITPPPIDIPAIISNDEYSGPYDFEVSIDPNYCNKNPWVYSSVLNKIFIGMSNAFPIDFKCKPFIKQLYVRATPIFSLAQHIQDLVTRCIPHSLQGETCNKDVSPDILDHILRCQNSNALYSGNKEQKKHLNVIVPLGFPQTGSEAVRIMYMFVCKNSCPTGMNRKPFEVVFTLEDEIGTVLGRHKIQIRVCSCPKRDKEKEEKVYIERHGYNSTNPPSKKRKLEKAVPSSTTEVSSMNDTKMYSVTLEICGKHNLEKIIRSAHDIIAGDLIHNSSNEALKNCFNTINNQLKDLQ